MTPFVIGTIFKSGNLHAHVMFQNKIFRAEQSCNHDCDFCVAKSFFFTRIIFWRDVSNFLLILKALDYLRP